MLDALRFVASAVARKDFVADLTHFKIKDGRITGYNGAMALSSDIDMDLDVQPKADKFLAAVKACEGVISLNVTPAGKLAIKAGRFKSFVECLAEESPHFVAPEGEPVDLGPGFMEGIKAISPVMGIDASRPWGMGIKLKGQFMFATNNAMMVQYWHGFDSPLDIIIPSIAINELLRIGEPPTQVQMTETSVTFWFGDKRWLRSNLIAGNDWPTDKIEGLFERCHGSPVALPPELKVGLEHLKPFLEDTLGITIDSEKIATRSDEGVGASYEVTGLGIVEPVIYSHHLLEILCDVATSADLTTFPQPAPFVGRNLRGIMAGLTR